MMRSQPFNALYLINFLFRLWKKVQIFNEYSKYDFFTLKQRVVFGIDCVRHFVTLFGVRSESQGCMYFMSYCPILTTNQHIFGYNSCVRAYNILVHPFIWYQFEIHPRPSGHQAIYWCGKSDYILRCVYSFMMHAM